MEAIRGKELEVWKADSDWRSAFQEAINGCDCEYDDRSEAISPVSEVLYAAEGENDENEWLAIVKWDGSEGQFAVIAAGCCYTGWDCQAGGTIEFYETLGMATTDLTPEQCTRLGLKHDSDRNEQCGTESDAT